MLQRLAADRLFKSLDNLEYGALELTTPDGKTRVFQGRRSGASAKVEMRDWRVAANLATKGDIGFAEDYKAGSWDTDNLQSLIELSLKNDKAFERYVLGSGLTRTISTLSYLLRLNTLKGSKKNIHAHYDLGNDFYRLWLDPTMTYSAALFRGDNDDLTNAQHNKYDRMIGELTARSGNILEIGCGWGGFAERALDQNDYAVKGITLSEQQHDYARQRLNGRADIALEDYRHQNGQYDGIVSIEMFEAVGEKFWPQYFQKLGTLLKKGGNAVIQTITIREQDFARYRRGGDFIRSFIFPGGMLPSVSRFQAEAERAGLKMAAPYHFGPDYGRTLALWLDNFDQKREEVKALGFDDGFIRLWRFYLAACAAGFNTGRTDVVQVELAHA